MKEPGFIKSVHRALGQKVPELWAWKINDSYSAGIPDCMYTGDRDMILAEYKLINETTWPKTIRAALSEQQKRRLAMIYTLRPGKVFVVVGVRVGVQLRLHVMQTPEEWEARVPFTPTKTVQDWADFVHSSCMRIPTKGSGETWTN